MSKQQAREQRIQQWLEHLRRWEAIGGSMVSYAKEHGLPVWALYQARSRLVRQGLWSANRRDSKAAPCNQVVPVHFARVAIAAPTPAYVLRLQLTNGRRAEIELAHVDPLVQLISALEKQP